MRRTEPIRVGELLKAVVGNHPKLALLLLESRVEEAWRALDPTIAGQTTRVTLVRGRLNVWIASAALRHEIFMCRTELAARINQTVGQQAVSVIHVK